MSIMMFTRGLWLTCRVFKRHWMALLLLIMLCFLYISFSDFTGDTDYDDVDEEDEVDVKAEELHAQDQYEYKEVSRACFRPALEFMPNSFRKFYKSNIPFSCPSRENWVQTMNGSIHMSKDILRQHGDDTKCKVIPFERDGDFKVKIRRDKERRVSTKRTQAESDFMIVECESSNSNEVHKNVQSTIAALPDMKRAAEFPEGGLGLNVLIFGFDSVSRLSWMRSLPKTHDWFTNTMGGVVLEGYNVVGDGTPQAMFPILTGHRETEFGEIRRGYMDSKVLDGIDWIWHDFKQAGYVTQWGEDGAKYGTFQYRMMGFKEQITHHHMRPFYILAEGHYGEHAPFCFYGTPRHVNMMMWVKDYFDVYRERPKMSFLFHSELTHDRLDMLPNIDGDMYQFLERMHKDGQLDNTMLILMSDHGIRYQTIRETVQGKYEERLPYFGIWLPDKIREAYPKLWRNLQLNVDRVTTPFDVHATLQSVLNFNPNELEVTPSLKERGISLFREVPNDRTCEQAGIEPHWCTCLRWQPTSPHEDDIQAVSWALMRQINELTRDFRDKCQELQMAAILRAEVFLPEAALLQYNGSKDIDGREPVFKSNLVTGDVLYQITVQTSPNMGIYEATVSLMHSEGRYAVDENQISRINRYGDQPSCIMKEHPHLRPFCYCG